jgi:hypothetical protein
LGKLPDELVNLVDANVIDERSSDTRVLLEGDQLLRSELHAILFTFDTSTFRHAQHSSLP